MFLPVTNENWGGGVKVLTEQRQRQIQEKESLNIEYSTAPIYAIIN
jgi:hypothetical protein